MSTGMNYPNAYNRRAVSLQKELEELVPLINWHVLHLWEMAARTELVLTYKIEARIFVNTHELKTEMEVNVELDAYKPKLTAQWITERIPFEFALAIRKWRP